MVVLDADNYEDALALRQANPEAIIRLSQSGGVMLYFPEDFPMPRYLCLASREAE